MDKGVVVAELDHASRWWNLPTLSEAGTLSSSVYDACGVTPVWKWTSKCIDTIDWWQGKVGTETYKFCNVDQWKKKKKAEIISCVKKFDPRRKPLVVAMKWERWKKNFQIYLAALRDVQEAHI